jgi:hypothetical protein
VKRLCHMLLPFVCSLFLLSACAPGSKLHIPGDLARPPFSGPRPAGPPRIAVADFSYAPAGAEGPDVIGRDYDRVRAVVWKGQPGRAMADLVAGALSEQGVPTVRVKAGEPAPENVPLLVSGTVRRFEVNARRRDVLKVFSEAIVTLSVSVTGAGASAPWEGSVTSSTTLQDIFPIPEDLQQALLSAANTAADEAARRIRESGASPAAFPAAGKGGDGTSR